MFCHPKSGGKLEQEWYAGHFRTALKTARITDYVRPFHDARSASLTNGAAGGERPFELMARAGRRSMATTQQYVPWPASRSPTPPSRSRIGSSGVESYTPLRRSQTTSAHLNPLNKRCS